MFGNDIIYCVVLGLILNGGIALHDF